MKNKLRELLIDEKINKLMVVSKSAFFRLELAEALTAVGTEWVLFDGYNSNPDYEDIVNGVELFRSSGCQAILAVGGGSTIDVAKCIKAYANMDPKVDYMEQTINPDDISVIAIPTTAGSGSEATPNAVIYRNKIKQSVANSSLRPDYVILDGSILKTLPLYQKKCTVLDALCQAIEAWWSLKSNEESRAYSRRAIELIMPNIRSYVSETADDKTYRDVMEGANLAGKAIAIAGTTVPHAMSYKLTGLYGIAHGHGVSLTLPRVWEHMWYNITECIDPRGEQYVGEVLEEIAKTVVDNEIRIADEIDESIVVSAIKRFDILLDDIRIEKPVYKTVEEIDELVSSVPESKCNTNPVNTTMDDIRNIYNTVVVGE